MRIGVISDTHSKMHPNVPGLFAGVDLVLHAGDIGKKVIIDQLSEIAPTHAVFGNIDDSFLRKTHPLFWADEIAGVSLFMTHILSERSEKGIQEGLINVKQKKTPDIFICGHSHIPETKKIGPVLLFNPGSAGPPRFKSKPTIGFIEIDEDGQFEGWIHKI